MTAPIDGRVETELLYRMLEPVQNALLADADIAAERVRAAAHAAVVRDVAEAEGEVTAAVNRARQRSERASRARSEQALGQRRREAHRHVLAEQEAIRGQFEQATESAFDALRDDPRYPALLDALERRARDQLGEQATLARDPVDMGGVVGTAGSRRVDYSLRALARRAAAALDEEVAELCR